MYVDFFQAIDANDNGIDPYSHVLPPSAAPVCHRTQFPFEVPGLVALSSSHRPVIARRLLESSTVG